MESILSAIYHGKFTAFEVKNEQGAAHTVALEKVDTLEEQFLEKLPKELHPLFDELRTAALNALDAYGLYDFTVGYRLGVQMMLAALPNEYGRNEHEKRGRKTS